MMKINKEYLLIGLIFLFGFLLRIFSIYPDNTIVGFDQARDFFDAKKIYQEKDLRIIGPTAGNNPNLHHGVAYLYYIIPPIVLGGGNPFWIAVWNSLFNALTIVVVYFFAKSLFDKKAAVISALLLTVSSYYIQFSGWLSNPTVTLLTVPLCFYFFYKYCLNNKQKFNLPLSAFFLGLSINFELFFIYLIPTLVVGWFILKPKFPDFKTLIYSTITFSLATLTMILTELKFNFAGVKSILFAGNLVGGQKEGFINNLISFITTRWEAFSQNLWPQNPKVAPILGIIAILYMLYEMYTNKKVIRKNLYVLLIFFSPAIMLILGSHNAPWFLIGRPIAVILMSAYLLSKIKPKFILFLILGFIIYFNLKATIASKDLGQTLLEPDRAGILSNQINAINYTYEKSGGESFAIDTVTNPLYINAVWAWNYNWIDKNYGYKPTFLGGDQVEPYNVLEKSQDKEKYFFIITDTTNRIPPVYKQNAVDSMKKKAKLIEEKEFNGIKVSFWENLKPQK